MNRDTDASPGLWACLEAEKHAKQGVREDRFLQNKAFKQHTHAT